MTNRRGALGRTLAILCLFATACGAGDEAEVSSQSSGGGLRQVPAEEVAGNATVRGEPCFGYYFGDEDCDAIAAMTQDIHSMPECSDVSATAIGDVLGEVAAAVSRFRTLHGTGRSDQVDSALLRRAGADELTTQLRSARISPECTTVLGQAAEQFLPCTTATSEESVLLRCD